MDYQPTTRPRPVRPTDSRAMRLVLIAACAVVLLIGLTLPAINWATIVVLGSIAAGGSLVYAVVARSGVATIAVALGLATIFCGLIDQAVVHDATARLEQIMNQGSGAVPIAPFEP